MDEDIVAPILYPAYIENEFRDRTLAYLDETHIITTERGDVHICSDFSTFVYKIIENNLLVFTMSLASFPWLAEVIDNGHQPFGNKDGKVLGIRIKGARNTTRWVASGPAWGADKLSIAWLKHMRVLFNLCQVGTPQSPGSFGQRLFRQSFKELYGEEWRIHRHRRPPEYAITLLQQEGSGARSEVFHLNTAFEVAYENDQKNGYGAALKQAQPTGKTYHIRASSADSYVFYFMECVVTIPYDLPFGVFPVRVGEKGNRYPTFPTEAGTYTTHLWKEEIQDAREIGCTVVLKRGIGWKEASYDFAPFVHKVSELRDKAPEELQPFLKLALVAYTGSLNVPTERYTIVPGNMRRKGDVCVADMEGAYDWWIHEEANLYPQNMPHIFYHTLMLCRRSLFAMLKKCWQEELNVIATNTDAVITEKRPADLPEKGTPVSTGQWTTLKLHDAIVTANRHLDSREKSVHPGRAKKVP